MTSSHVLMKAHVLTGDDTVTKVGSKHAVVVKTPLAYLYNFGEDEDISVTEISMAEAYLVQVWVGVCTKAMCKTFDQLRCGTYECGDPTGHAPPVEFKHSGAH